MSASRSPRCILAVETRRVPRATLPVKNRAGAWSGFPFIPSGRVVIMQRMWPIIRTQSSNRRSPCSAARLSLIAGVMWSCAAAATAPPPEIPVGRYSSVQALATPEQTDPLAAIVRVIFPESVDSVGAAVAHALETSGYRVADDAATHAARSALFALPLPDVHRVLGPLPLRAVLETLAGPGYRLIEDPVHRLVSFERCGDRSAHRTTYASEPGRSE